MPAFTAVLQQAIRKAGFGYHLPNADLAIGSSTTFTYKPLFMDASGELTTNSYRGWTVVRWGAASSADYTRHIVSIAPDTGVATVDVAWADTTATGEDFYLFPPRITPEMVVLAANMSLRPAYFPNLEPLSIKPVGTGISDAGFQNTATSAWTSFGTTTFTKDGTANSENVFPTRIKAGKIANSAVTSGVYQQFAVEENELIYVHSLTRLDSGTSSQLRLSDDTGANANAGTTIGTTHEHTQRKWQYARRQETMPEDCTLLTVSLLGEGDSDNVYLNGLWVMPASTKRLVLDTRWDTAFKMPSLAYVKFGQSVAQGTFDALATDLIEIDRELYDWDISQPGANPSAIQFHDGIEEYLRYPIYIQGRRSYADLYSVTMADVTTSVPIDQDLWDALFRAEFYGMGEVQRRIPDWQYQLQRAQWEVSQANARVSPREQPARRRQFATWGAGAV